MSAGVRVDREGNSWKQTGLIRVGGAFKSVLHFILR